ncbi:pyrimidine reductase family protein [Phytoactinopolyspora limicola]|uniref:pyrimidine reductase family protein n=1 Tax=Phytoactinopolyspora limicola TaxID=2715536 RepID=UPI001A9C973B|nr:pyrimidine reductase family protein [Phytoactinopolyspora limicola]
MRLIYPPRGSAMDPDADLTRPDRLAAAYGYPDVDGRHVWLRANMVSSIDGAAQGHDGRSGTLSSPADQHVLALLRALADVVLVGAGTARAERYGPAEPNPRFAGLRAGRSASPPMAVVSRRLDLHPASPLFTRAEELTGSPQRTIVFTVDAAPTDRRSALAEVADVIVAGDTDIDLPAAMAHLAERGLPRVLCEGGPQLLAHVVQAGVLDELCYTMTPMLAGGYATHILDGAPVDGSPWRLAHVIEADGTLLTRWLAPSG